MTPPLHRTAEAAAPLLNTTTSHPPFLQWAHSPRRLQRPRLLQHPPASHAAPLSPPSCLPCATRPPPPSPPLPTLDRAGAILLVAFLVLGWRRYRGYRQLPLSSRAPRAGTPSVSGGSSSASSPAGREASVGGSTASLEGPDGVDMVGVEHAEVEATSRPASAGGSGGARVMQVQPSAGKGVGGGAGVVV
jgi:hypothetical protein